MRSIITLAVSGLMLASAPALAADWTQSSFNRDGEHYIVKTAVVGDRTLVRGHTADSAFYLVVRGDRVSGTVNGHNVSFRTSETNAVMASR